MKKSIFAATLLLTATLALAQNSDRSRFTLGTKGGFGSSWIKPGTNSFNGSWFIGLATMYQASNHIGIGADVLYSSEGATRKIADVSSTTELEYLRIPLKVSYYFAGMDNDFRPRITVAPNFGFLMNDPGNTSAGYETMDFGANVAAGLEYMVLDNFWLTFDANYYNGFMDIYKGNSDKDMNRNLRLDIGLMIGF